MPNPRSSRAGLGARLRVAQVAPLYESVPPQLYGGTERVVSYLTDELVSRGHQVDLFAAGDSVSAARVRPGTPTALRIAGLSHLGPTLQLPMLSDLFEDASSYDVIHSHVDHWGFPFARLVATPTLSTMHSRLDLPTLAPVLNFYRDCNLVSVSNAQRAPLPHLNWRGTVYHGLPRGLLRYSPGPGKYLAFLGRISPEKRPDLAIEVARQSGVPLKIAAKVDDVDREYFEAVIRPKLAPPAVELIGEITEAEKSRFLGDALALLFPVDWPEPFGLVIIEALACGTPVIARPCGSVPELLRDRVTGFIASELTDLVRAVSQVEQISRLRCRQEFDRRFSAPAMAEGYERIYRQLHAQSEPEPSALNEALEARPGK